MREGPYKTKLIKKLETRFPGCIILKNDASYRQGVPDLIVLWNDKWAMLEVKPKQPKSSNDFEPNQEWYLEVLDDMSFATCVYPENEVEVLDAIQRQFETRRKTRVSKR